MSLVSWWLSRPSWVFFGCILLGIGFLIWASLGWQLALLAMSFTVCLLSLKAWTDHLHQRTLGGDGR